MATKCAILHFMYGWIILPLAIIIMVLDLQWQSIKILQNIYKSSSIPSNSLRPATQKKQCCPQTQEVIVMVYDGNYNHSVSLPLTMML